MTRIMGIFLLAGILYCAGCGSRTAHEKDRSMPSDNGEEQAFIIEVGEQGGFTGGYNGHTIDGSGSVTRIDRLPGQEAREESLGVVSTEDMASVRDLIRSIDFFQIIYTNRGDMTYTIAVRKGTEEHGVSWPPGDMDVPPDLIKLRGVLLEVIKRVK